MRHYHPDTNPDPAAQDRAREITAAYAVLRDPGNRAAYDAGRAAGLDSVEHDEPRRPPPMRAASIVSAVLALGLVAAVWAWPRPDPPAPGSRPATSKAITSGSGERARKSLRPIWNPKANGLRSSPRAPPPRRRSRSLQSRFRLSQGRIRRSPRRGRSRPSTAALASAAVAPPRRKAIAEARRPAPEVAQAGSTGTALNRYRRPARDARSPVRRLLQPVDGPRQRRQEAAIACRPRPLGGQAQGVPFGLVRRRRLSSPDPPDERDHGAPARNAEISAATPSARGRASSVPSIASTLHGPGPANTRYRNAKQNRIAPSPLLASG